MTAPIGMTDCKHETHGVLGSPLGQRDGIMIKWDSDIRQPADPECSMQAKSEDEKKRLGYRQVVLEALLQS
jgi:hypothetical protein